MELQRRDKSKSVMMKRLTELCCHICSFVLCVLPRLLCFYQFVSAQMTLPRNLFFVASKAQDVVLGGPIKV